MSLNRTTFSIIILLALLALVSSVLWLSPGSSGDAGGNPTPSGQGSLGASPTRTVPNNPGPTTGAQ
jgi:hypothetical protein